MISLLLLCSGLGSLLAGVLPALGAVLTVLGVVGSIWSYVSSERRTADMQRVLEMQIALSVRAGIGNAYTQSAKAQIARTGSCSGAVRMLLSALRLDSDDIEALEMLAGILPLQLSTEQWAKAPVALRRSGEVQFVRELAKRGKKRDPNNHVFYDALGILCDIEGLHEQARGWFKNSGKLREDPYWHVLMSNSWAMDGKYQKALDEIGLAVREGIQEELVAFERGRLLCGIGSPDEAEPYLVDALRMRRGSPLVLESLAESLFFQMKFLKAALASVRVAARMLPFYPLKGLFHIGKALLSVFLAMSTTCSRRAWRYTSRRRALRWIHMHTVSPDEPEASLAFQLIKRGGYELAARYLAVAAELDPNNVGALSNLSVCLAKLGRRDEAIEAGRRALEIDPGNEALQWNLEQVEVHQLGPGTSGRMVEVRGRKGSLAGGKVVGEHHEPWDKP